MASGYCAQCFTGTLRGDVEPTGTVETVHGLATYVARPPPGQSQLGTLVLISDAMGWELPNTRALADVYARRGPFTVYVPDFLDGYAIPVNDLILADKINDKSAGFLTTLFMKPIWWLQFAKDLIPFAIYSREAVVKPRIQAFFQAQRAAAPTNLGVVGFCWGGRYTALLCGSAFHRPDDTAPLVDCGFTAHPSLLAIPSEIEAVVQPLSVANGEDDLWMGREKMQILQKTLEDKKAGHEVVVYDGAVHGFAVRGDPRDPKQAEMGLKAEDQAVAWFKKQFAA